MKAWIKASIRRAVPYGLYLIVFSFFVWGYQISKNNPAAADPTGLWTFLLIGTSIGAFIALWRFAMAFAPDAQFSEQSTEYIEVPQTPDKRSFSELLLSHARQLRRVALSYEKHRQNLSLIGITVAVASLAVPIATWTVILSDAFKTKETMPNAWLLVISSTTSGALGLAISVALLGRVDVSHR